MVEKRPSRRRRLGLAQIDRERMFFLVHGIGERFAISRRNDLCGNADGDFGRRLPTRIDPDGSMDLSE